MGREDDFIRHAGIFVPVLNNTYYLSTQVLGEFIYVPKKLLNRIPNE